LVANRLPPSARQNPRLKIRRAALRGAAADSRLKGL